MKTLTRALICCACLSASLAAMAQYQWTDANGRRVFSDRPPPASEQAKGVTSKPMRGIKGTGTAPDTAEAPASAASDAAKAATGDKQLEAKKQQAEAAEAAKKKAEEAKLAAARAENCKRARDAKAGLDAGQRIGRSNAKGEVEILDDKQRAQESSRLQDIIKQDCK